MVYQEKFVSLMKKLALCTLLATFTGQTTPHAQKSYLFTHLAFIAKNFEQTTVPANSYWQQLAHRALSDSNVQNAHDIPIRVMHKEELLKNILPASPDQTAHDTAHTQQGQTQLLAYCYDSHICFHEQELLTRSLPEHIFAAYHEAAHWALGHCQDKNKAEEIKEDEADTHAMYTLIKKRGHAIIVAYLMRYKDHYRDIPEYTRLSALYAKAQQKASQST